jgi:hypothetical protein
LYLSGVIVGMATRNEILNTKNTVKGLCKMASQLGYKDPAFQLLNSDGSVVGDLLYFLEDNPGAIEAVNYPRHKAGGL